MIAKPAFCLLLVAFSAIDGQQADQGDDDKEERIPEEIKKEEEVERPNKGEDQLKRYVIEDDFKPAIFGSYHFDPIKQEFNVLRKKGGPHNCESEVRTKKKKKGERSQDTDNNIIEHEYVQVNNDNGVNSSLNSNNGSMQMRKMMADYRTTATNVDQNATTTVKTNGLQELNNENATKNYIIKKVWKKVLITARPDQYNNGYTVVTTRANVWVPDYESVAKYTSRRFSTVKVDEIATEKNSIYLKKLR